MTFKFRIRRNPVVIRNQPFPSLESSVEPEVLSGEVNGMPASAPEERLARAFDKAGIQYVFRYVVGAPKGLPGWKELDFIVLTRGILYPVEVDTAFTHRSKESADVLHDAIVQNDPELQSMGLMWPYVTHVDGDYDLASGDMSEKYVKRTFNK